MKGRAIKYTPEQEKYLRQRSGMVRSKLAAKFNRKFGTDISVDNIKAKCTRMGLKTGRTGCFEKGHIPHPDAHAKGPNKTSFKKGQSPVNHRPVGSERISKDGYIEIKIAEPRKWALKHRIVWESKNGKIPKGHIVVFEDGNKLNLDLENLRLISRSDNAILNKYGLRNVADEVKPAAITYGQLYNKTRQMERAR